MGVGQGRVMKERHKTLGMSIRSVRVRPIALEGRWKGYWRVWLCFHFKRWGIGVIHNVPVTASRTITRKARMKPKTSRPKP